MQIGVMFRREQAPATLAAYARHAETLGFDELWVVEDCFFTGGVAQAAAALTATSRITVGLGIAPAVARNPAFLAMEFATLACMHPGRFHGGIGHGVAEWMEQIGAKPASWLVALEETTIAVRELLRGEHLTMDGDHVYLRDVQLEHVPDPVPPVSLGVRGPKSLQVVGRSADGVLLIEASAPAYVASAREQIAAGAREAGRDDGHRVTVYANCLVSEREPDSARDVIRRVTAEMLGGGAAPQVTPLPYAADLASLVEKGGAEALYREMPNAWLEDLAITGRPDDGAVSIRRLANAGADAVVLVPPVTVDPEEWLATVGTTLLPLLRG